MTEETPLRSLGHTVDWRLVILYLLIMLFGWMNIYAAVQSMEPSGIFDLRYNCGKQALWIGGALLLAVLPGALMRVTDPLVERIRGRSRKDGRTPR